MRIRREKNGESYSAFTSMIDIVFLLLIFFVLQPFKAPELFLETPMDPVGSDTDMHVPTELPPLPVRLELRQQNGRVAYRINGQVVGGAGADLVPSLVAASLGDETVPVVLDVGDDVAMGHVIHALDRCRRADLGKVRFLDKR